MLAGKDLRILLASRESTLAETLKLAIGSGTRVDVTDCVEDALAAMNGPEPPHAVLLDEQMPGLDAAEGLGRFLAAARPASEGRFPIVVIADSTQEEWAAWMEAGMFDDLIPRSTESAHWRLRMASALRAHSEARELKRLRESHADDAQRDPLTGVYDRPTLLSLLFRETDRAQRMKSALALIVFDIDDFRHWNLRLGAEVCDELLWRVVERTLRLLRSYDVLGRLGEDEFLVVLPGCGCANAMMLAERLRMEVFAMPFQAAETEVRLSACYGVASSEGRSPVVVLREAEQALQAAKETEPETIRSFSGRAACETSPVAFLVPNSEDRSLDW
jgi:two-component system cell cycle response regulator